MANRFPKESTAKKFLPAAQEREMEAGDFSRRDEKERRERPRVFRKP